MNRPRTWYDQLLLVEEANIISQTAGISDKKLVTEKDHPSWFSKCRTVLVKNTQQNPMASHYVPIICLRITCMLVPGILADKIREYIKEYVLQT